MLSSNINRSFAQHMNVTLEPDPRTPSVTAGLPRRTISVETIVVDGIDRPIVDANGRRIASDRDGQERFWRWFGDSAVVDHLGRPTPQFHGTSRSFDAFDTRRGELGSHFGTHAQANAAASIAIQKKGVGCVIPVYLSIKSPLRLVDVGAFDSEEVGRQLAEMGLISGAEADRYFRALYDEDCKPRAIQAELQSAISAAGYDGVVYLNRQEGLRTNATGEKVSDDEIRKRYPEAMDSYIAFRSSQVKSAIGNCGLFSRLQSTLTDQPAIVGSSTRARLRP